MEGDEKMEGDMKRKKSKRGRGRRWKKKKDVDGVIKKGKHIKKL